MIPSLRVQVVLRDRQILDVLDLSLRFVARHFKAFGIVALVVLVPAYAISLWIGTAFGWAIGWVVAVVLAAICQTPFTLLASKLVFEEKAAVTSSMVAAWHAMPRLLLVRTGQVLVLCFAFSFCFAPLLFVAPSVFFLPEVVLLEGCGIGIAVDRARKLAASGTGDTFFAWLVLLAGTLASVFVLGDYVGRMILEKLLEISPPPSIWSSGGNTTALLGFFLFVPFLAAARFFVYINMRTRSEGWDIQAKFFALRLRAEEAA